ncbi:AraC family transcriptional regulator [Chryseobacterium sp. RG1]|uniref:AraC family transcriptional regulator n=1 Tax=Chryseobacterium tagetis TaxID=2801334 RepID=A0ABS8A4F9_9FLAO|nr:AraC family transcriptional regulator [Chryseobacterium tagetis]MCA6067785.1 AraC family transcriptional regulator [Chryseobacterium tagetis]
MHLNTKQLDQIGFNINWLGIILGNSSRIKEFNTLDYFWIYIILEDLELKVECKLHYIKKESIVFVGPQKKFSFNIVSGKEVMAVVFSQNFYEHSVKDSMFLNSELFFNYDSNLFVAPLSAVDEIKTNINERIQFFKSKNRNLYSAVAHNLIERLILDAFAYLPVKESKNNVSYDSRYYVNRFLLLLHRDYKENKKVIDYADQLHISARKLSELTEIILGKTAKQVIIEKLISEYKKFKNYTNNNNSQICYELGFNNEGNFSNFIKKHTGKNPSEF